MKESTNLYDILDIAPDADNDTVRAAYRRKAQQTHPDREGGDEDAFKAVNEAYETLIDGERRAYYDATGRSQKPKGLDEQALAQLTQLFGQWMENKVDVEHSNFVEDMRAAVNSNLAPRRQALRRRKNAFERLSFKGAKTSPLHNLAAQQIAQLEQQVAVGERMLEMLEDYSYAADLISNMNGFFQSETATGAWR